MIKKTEVTETKLELRDFIISYKDGKYTFNLDLNDEEDNYFTLDVFQFRDLKTLVNSCAD